MQLPMWLLETSASEVHITGYVDIRITCLLGEVIKEGSHGKN